MEALLDHALLALGVWLVGATGWRIADRAADRGLVRVIAAATLAAALVVVQALALGLVSLAGEPLALLALAGAGWLAALRLLPAPGLTVRDELGTWWARAPRGPRAGTAALLAIGLGWITWQIRHPYVGEDGLTYHLGLAASYAASGIPGSLPELLAGVPVANYPVTNEVLIGWALALGDAWPIASAWTVALLALLVASATVGLRTLDVPPRVVVAAIAAFCSLPLVATQLGGPLTDVACVAWLTTAVALCAVARARQRPELLAVALVAAALSFGTKTTGSALLVAALLVTAFGLRRHLGALPRPWLLAAPLALIAGGVWVARNTVTHGSPLWPFVSGPFGDPIPRAFVGFDASFLSRPATMLDGRVDDYVTLLSGGVFLLAGGLLAALVARTRAASAATAVAAAAMLVWAAAPYTGIDETSLAVGATRYLLPALAAATLAIAIAARDSGRSASRVLLVLLWTTAFLSASRTLQLGFPFVPSAGTILVLGGLGAGGGLLAGRRVLRLAPIAAAAFLVLVLAQGRDGYLLRHAESGLVDSGLVRAVSAQPAFRADEGIEISMGPGQIALLRGERLQHDLRFLPADTPCAEVRRRAQDGNWVILQRAPPTPEYRRLAACLGEPGWNDAAYELHGG